MGDKDNENLDSLYKSLGKYAEVVMSQIASNFSAKAIEKQIGLYEEKAINVVKAFGTGRDRIVEMKASMADAVEEVTKLGGGLDSVAGIAEKVSSKLNRNLILTKDTYKEIFATFQVTGVETGTLIEKFKDAGFSLNQISGNMKKVVDIATASGVNAQAVAGTVATNLGMLDKYNFSNGVEGLAKMVTQATNLRIDVKSIERLMDAAFKPDKAIEMAASLQRLGVQQTALLDPLRLMDMARNDPAEFQNQIVEMTKSFVKFDEKSKSFQIAPGAKGQLMEIASELNMNYEDLVKMGKSAAELQDKMSKIHFPSDAFTEEQKTLIANMAEMDAGGEYKLRIDGKELGLDEAMIKIQSMDEESRKKFLADSKPKTMEEMAKEQLTAAQRTAAAVESLANREGAAQASSKQQEMAMRADIEVADQMSKILGGPEWKTENLRESQDKIAMNLISGVQQGDVFGSIGRAAEETKSHLASLLTSTVEGGAAAIKGLGESANPLINIFSGFATKVGDVVGANEKLTTSFNTLNTTIGATNTKLGGTTTTTTPKITATALPKTTDTNEIKNTLEVKPTTETSSTEVKFNPLDIKLTISGLLPGMTEEQIKQIIIDGKLNEVIYNAVKDAEKTKVK